MRHACRRHLVEFFPTRGLCSESNVEYVFSDAAVIVLSGQEGAGDWMPEWNWRRVWFHGLCFAAGDVRFCRDGGV